MTTHDATQLLTRPHFAPLESYQFVNLTTYRKDGTPVTRPVWFALEGDTLVITTQEDSGKVRQVRRDPRVRVQPADARGNTLSDITADGIGQVVVKGTAEWDTANRALSRKYGLMKRVFELLQFFTRPTIVHIIVKPA